MLQRVKEVQESDLRMDGALARNIQRVLAVTQADIDAAAAQGKGWLVKRVVKVNDPLNNLRGGTQLVIKQNSIQPGQNVMRVLYSGNSKTVGPAVAPLSLSGAAAEDILSLIAFGGTKQGLPDGYQQLVSLTTDNASYFDADYIINSFDVDVTIDAAMTLLASGPNMLWGFMGSSSNLPRWGVGTYQNNWLMGANTTQTSGVADTDRHITTGVLFYNENNTPCYSFVLDGVESTVLGTTNAETITGNTLSTFIGARNNRGTAGNFNPSTFYSFKIEKAGELVVNMVPAKRLSDNVVGFYDTVRDRFFTNAGTGTITAGDAAVPIPDYPQNIVCNNGVLKARHESGLPLGYQKVEYVTNTVSGTNAYISVGGLCEDNKTTGTCEYETTMSFANVNIRQIFGYGGSQRNHYFGIQSTHPEIGATGTGINTQVTLSTDTKYTFKVKYGRDSSTNTELWVYDDNGNLLPNGYNTNNMYLGVETSNYFIFKSNYTGIAGVTGCKFYGAKIWFDNTQVGNLIPSVRNSDSAIGVYNTVDGTFWTKVGDVIAGDPVSDPVEVYAAGPIETIAIKDDQDATVSTATCEYLLAFDADHTDEQEIISGTVTRKVSALVLTGDEDGWVKSNNVTIYNLGVWSTPIQYSPDRVPIYCTHYVGTDATNANSPDKSIKLSNSSYFSGNGTVIIKDSSCANLAAWKAFLKSQYSAGTPVIVVFPAENTTTESVTGQPMQTAAGDNTAEITQAGMAGLELEVEYIGA